MSAIGASDRPGPRPRAAVAALILAVLAGVALRAAFREVPRRTPDERFYTFYGAELVEHGPAYARELVRLYRQDESLGQYPSPTRVGSLWPIAGFMWLSGDTSADATARLSALASLVALAGTALLGMHLLPPWGAAAAVLFAAVSPLDLAIARRGWQDGVFALLALGMLGATLAFRRRPHAAWCVVFLALGSWAVLVKESGALLIALGAGAMALAVRRHVAAVAAIAAGAAFALALATGVLVWVSGGLAPLGDMLSGVGVTRNEYMRLYQTGSPLYYVRGLALTQPLPFLLGLVGAALAARGRLVAGAQARDGAAVVGWYVLAYAAISCVFPQKNLRFLSPVYAPVYVLAGGIVARALAAAGSRGRAAVALVAVVVLGSACWDVWRFVDLFVLRAVPDLATPLFTLIQR